MYSTFNYAQISIVNHGWMAFKQVENDKHLNEIQTQSKLTFIHFVAKGQ